MTVRVVVGQKGANGTKVVGKCALGRFYRRLVHQHYGYVVANGINSPALAALQAIAVAFQFQRFLANRADQDFQQFFVNHAPNFTPLSGSE